MDTVMYQYIPMYWLVFQVFTEPYLAISLLR